MSQELKQNQNQTPEEEMPKWGRTVTEEQPTPSRSARRPSASAAGDLLKKGTLPSGTHKSEGERELAV